LAKVVDRSADPTFLQWWIAPPIQLLYSSGSLRRSNFFTVVDRSADPTAFYSKFRIALKNFVSIGGAIDNYLRERSTTNAVGILKNLNRLH